MEEVKSLDDIKALLVKRGPVICEHMGRQYEYERLEKISFSRDWKTKRLRQTCFLYSPTSHSAEEVEIRKVFFKSDKEKTEETKETEAQEKLKSCLEYFEALLEDMALKASRGYYGRGIDLTHEALKAIVKLKQAFDACDREKAESVGR